jgi:hypothetical protein
VISNKALDIGRVATGSSSPPQLADWLFSEKWIKRIYKSDLGVLVAEFVGGLLFLERFVFTGKGIAMSTLSVCPLDMLVLEIDGQLRKKLRATKLEILGGFDSVTTKEFLVPFVKSCGATFLKLKGPSFQEFGTMLGQDSFEKINSWHLIQDQITQAAVVRLQSKTVLLSSCVVTATLPLPENFILLGEKNKDGEGNLIVDGLSNHGAKSTSTSEGTEEEGEEQEEESEAEANYEDYDFEEEDWHFG